MFLKIYNNKKLQIVIPFDQVIELGLEETPTVDGDKEFLGIRTTKNDYTLHKSQYVYDLTLLLNDMRDNIDHDIYRR